MSLSDELAKISEETLERNKAEESKDEIYETATEIAIGIRKILPEIAKKGQFYAEGIVSRYFDGDGVSRDYRFFDDVDLDEEYGYYTYFYDKNHRPSVTKEAAESFLRNVSSKSDGKTGIKKVYYTKVLAAHNTDMDVSLLAKYVQEILVENGLTAKVSTIAKQVNRKPSKYYKNGKVHEIQLPQLTVMVLYVYIEWGSQEQIKEQKQREQSILQDFNEFYEKKNNALKLSKSSRIVMFIISVLFILGIIFTSWNVLVKIILGILGVFLFIIAMGNSEYPREAALKEWNEAHPDKKVK